MKTNIAMIPLAFLILTLMRSLGFGMEPPRKMHLNNNLFIEQSMQAENEAYPILSTKDYDYNAENALVAKQVIVFLFEDLAIATITIDEYGNYSQSVKYLNGKPSHEENITIETEETSLLENLRGEIHNLYNEACNWVFNPAKNETSNEMQSEPTQQDGKYFMSDYEQN